MPTKAAPIVGDTLWLGITALVFAVILVIMSWPLSAELSRRILVGAAPGGPTVAIVPEMGAGSVGTPSSPTFGNRILAPGTPSTKASEVAEGSSSVAPTTSIVAPTELAGLKSSLRDPIADQLANQPLADLGGLGVAPREPQPAQSASATPAAHPLGPHRQQQHHQRARPIARGTGTELVPW